MDDNVFTILALSATILIGSIGAGILVRFRSFLRNLSELFIAIDNCLTDDCTTDELKTIVKEGKETVDDGLGIWSALLAIFQR